MQGESTKKVKTEGADLRRDSKSKSIMKNYFFLQIWPKVKTGYTLGLGTRDELPVRFNPCFRLSFGCSENLVNGQTK